MAEFKKYNQSKNQGKDRRYGVDRQGSHKAICSKCGTTCEVPFKPNGKKPVFCSACFRTEGHTKVDTDIVNQRYPHQTYPQNSHSQHRAVSHDGQNADLYQVKEKLHVMNNKLDLIIQELSKIQLHTKEPSQPTLIRNAEITPDLS